MAAKDRLVKASGCGSGERQRSQPVAATTGADLEKGDPVRPDEMFRVPILVPYATKFGRAHAMLQRHPLPRVLLWH
jgi:hypothetical protein